MEINMKNIKKVGLSALAGALAFTSANAGDVSLSGSMIASYTKKGGYNTDGNPLGMNKELSVTASGELDNGVGVAYKQTITNAMAYNDSELVFTGVPMMGDASLALTSTGSPLDAIDDKTPVAFEEANAAVGSIKDVSGINGTYGIRYTLADVMGSGVKLDAMYTPRHGTGDAQSEKGVSGNTNVDGKDGYDIVISGAIPGVEGLDFGAGYSSKENHAVSAAVSSTDEDEGTAYLNYAFGGLKVGAQRGVVSQDGSAEVTYDNEYIGISYAISDSLSVSYNDIESRKTNDSVSEVIQDMDSVSLSYTSGGMTIGILDSDCGNCSYTKNRNQSARAIQMTVAF